MPRRNIPDTFVRHNEDMPFLLRIELPDVPGSLGGVATALGAVGADIEAIQIVEHRPDGVAVDDVLLELPANVLPDALLTACHAVEGVRVTWISHYHAGASLSLDLETIESFTTDPRHALQHLVDATPMTFRTDWALLLELGETLDVSYATPAAPQLSERMLSTIDLEQLDSLTMFDEIPTTLIAAVTCETDDGQRFALLTGRPGGPEFITSEVARLKHMANLAASVQIPKARLA